MPRHDDSLLVVDVRIPGDYIFAFFLGPIPASPIPLRRQDAVAVAMMSPCLASNLESKDTLAGGPIVFLQESAKNLFGQKGLVVEYGATLVGAFQALS